MAALAVACAARGAPAIAPSAGSDAILALRAQTRGALVLQYRKEAAGAQPEIVSIGIAPDYHYIDSGGRTRIYDYRLRRIFTVMHSTGALVDDSLYADVWRRTTQLLSEAARASTTGTTPVTSPTASSDAFWIESATGMISDALPRPALRQVFDGTRSEWTLGGHPVAAVRYDPETVPTPIRRSLRRFWATFLPVHPAIAEALAASGRMPAELWLKGDRFSEPAPMPHWTLTRVRWDPGARFPLPPHLRAQPTTNAGSYPQIFATLAEFVDRHEAPPSQHTYKLRAETAIWRGLGLEAMLWLTEMDLARGPPPRCGQEDSSPSCDLWEQAERLGKRDPRTATAFGERAPDEVERGRFNALPNRYMLKFLWATLPQGAGVRPEEGELGLLAALRASPVANFCKDVGTFYASEGKPFAAWQAWDFGRLMASHTSGDLLDSIDILEADLAAKEPAFF